MYLPRGYNPTQNQSEAGVPLDSRAGFVYRGAGWALTRGFQTYLPGPYHFEDQIGEVRSKPYMPAPVVQFNAGFDGDVPLREAPTYRSLSPWRRKAPG